MTSRNQGSFSKQEREPWQRGWIAVIIIACTPGIIWKESITLVKDPSKKITGTNYSSQSTEYGGKSTEDNEKNMLLK